VLKKRGVMYDKGKCVAQSAVETVSLGLYVFV
jgi:hypothetical protein